MKKRYCVAKGGRNILQVLSGTLRSSWRLGQGPKSWSGLCPLISLPQSNSSSLCSKISFQVRTVRTLLLSISAVSRGSLLTSLGGWVRSARQECLMSNLLLVCRGSSYSLLRSPPPVVSIGLPDSIDHHLLSLSGAESLVSRRRHDDSGQ